MSTEEEPKPTHDEPAQDEPAQDEPGDVVDPVKFMQAVALKLSSIEREMEWHDAVLHALTVAQLMKMKRTHSSYHVLSKFFERKRG
jgi:hypothetical protein